MRATKQTLTERVGIIVAIIIIIVAILWLGVGRESKESRTEMNNAQIEQMRQELKQEVDSLTKYQPKHKTAKTKTKKNKRKKLTKTNKKQGLHSRNYFEDKEIIPENN
jgi:type II secretory pathway pseudopilin PulG